MAVGLTPTHEGRGGQKGTDMAVGLTPTQEGGEAEGDGHGRRIDSDAGGGGAEGDGRHRIDSDAGGEGGRGIDHCSEATLENPLQTAMHTVLYPSTLR